LESLQAKIDWGVNSDTTWFQIETPPNNFESVLEIFGRLLVTDNVRPEAFKNAQQQLIENNKSRRLSPAEQADEAFLAALYGDHPYGHTIDGSAASVAGIKQGDVYDFMRRLYLANDVSTIIVGKVSQERAMRAFKIFFGGWIKGQIAPNTFRPPKQVALLNLVKIDAPDATEVELRGGLVGVRHNDPDFLTTEIMAQILSARLKKSAEGMARAIDVKAPPRILPGPFYYTATAPADKVQALSRLATEAFATLATAPVSNEELAAAKSALAAEYSAKPVERYLREIEIYSLPRNYPEKITPNIEKIAAADIHRVAKKLFETNAMTIVVSGKLGDIFKSNP
jgi:zinc protease